MFDTYTNNDSFKEANGYTIDDVWYPRVTRIVSIKAKPALLRFYADAVNFQAAQNVTTKSAEEGTMVHEAAEALLLGKEPVVDPTIRPAIDAFRKFLDERNIQTSPEYVEQRVWHPEHRYAGTVDALALIGGKFGVLDIKTSQGIYRDYNLQTAAYMEALNRKYPQLQTRWILRIDQIQQCRRCSATRRTKGGREKIRRNGTVFCSEHDWGEPIGVLEMREFPYWRSDFEAFLGAKRLWEWENEDWLKKVGYL